MGGVLSGTDFNATNTVYRMEDGFWSTATPMLTRRAAHCVVVFGNVAIVTGDGSYSF